MRSRLEILDEVLCHCPAGPDGHAPASAPGCEAPEIKRHSYARPTIDSIASNSGHTGTGVHVRVTQARGTCPVCGRAGVRVQRVQVFAAYDRGRRLPPVTNPAKPRGMLLEVRPGMAPHRVAGEACSGEGWVPAEVRYMPGYELAEYLRLLAEEQEVSA